MSTPPIFKDPIYLHCLSLARKSQGKKERYGSYLLRGKESSWGYNRAVANGAITLPRIIRQGYANHAEVESLNMALKKG